MSGRSGYTHEQMAIYRSGAIEAAQLAAPCEDSELRHVSVDCQNLDGIGGQIERGLSAQRNPA